MDADLTSPDDFKSQILDSNECGRVGLIVGISVNINSPNPTNITLFSLHVATSARENVPSIATPSKILTNLTNAQSP
ncbi:hypothetical protein N7527_002521 [Penicillium freii]|nr:hypothetical protein N7527_002521 [Penicillium freii]